MAKYTIEHKLLYLPIRLGGRAWRLLARVLHLAPFLSLGYGISGYQPDPAIEELST